MGKFSQGVLGKTRGKVDGVVIQRFRAGYINRERVTPRNPRTQPQVLQRTKLAAISGYTKAFRPVADVGFKRAAQGTMMSPANLFAKLNFPALTMVGGSVTMTYTQMIVAKGGIADILAYNAPRFDTPGQVTISYSPIGDTTQWPSSGLLQDVVVYCPDLNVVVYSRGNEVRPVDSSFVVPVPDGWDGLKVHVWAFCRYSGESQYGFQQGDVTYSAYLGSGNIS